MNRFALTSAAAAALVAIVAFAAGVGAAADGALFDLQTRAVRALRAGETVSPGASDPVVLVGIDEATLAAIDAPLALWHAELGAALAALAQARPRLVALDIVLPERSYEQRAPGLDRALIRGLVAAREAGGVVLALQPDAQGRLRPVHPPFLAAAGDDAFGAATWRVDADGTVRRFDPQVTTFVSAIAARLARPAAGGYVDYTIGTPFGYVPLQELLERAARGDETWVAGRFAGRVVLVGSVLPFADRRAQPVSLAGWEPAHTEPPGLLIHAQAVRSLLGRGFIRPAPAWAVVLAAIAFAALALVGRPAWRWALFAAAIVASFAAAAAALGAGQHVPLAAAWGAGALAVALRTTFDARHWRRERNRVAQTFAGYVSPQVFDGVVAGTLPRRGRATLAVLFADVRGFTTMTEQQPAGDVVDLLNRYYAVVTPIVHAHGGMVDSFRGDGLTAAFGAPQPLADAPVAAVRTARELLRAVAQLNATLQAEGRAPLRVGIGLAWGEAVFGDLGSADRRDFTLIGDAVNLAARLQDLTKELGVPMLATDALHAALPQGEADAWVDRGLQPIRGHSPVRVWGAEG
jgi:class 3 adenylate cyclase